MAIVLTFVEMYRKAWPPWGDQQKPREDKMGSINRCLLALATLVLLVPCGAASAQSPSTSVETEYLMTLEGICEPGQPMGQRLVVNCTGGSVHGPKINGTVIPPTGDWLVPLGEGHLRLDVRGTIKTDDGCHRACAGLGGATTGFSGKPV